jgi:hypothetical protein
MQNPATFVPPQQQTQIPANPLTMFMRQPKFYINLPSGGEYWPAGSIQLPEDGNIPVYSMTAKDELLLNVPDALMNGQAVVDVIQNCIPCIKNAWQIPNIDMDAILIGIRIASYGEMMTTPIKISEDIEYDYKVDLRTILINLLNNVKWDPVIPVNSDMTVFVRPLNYKQVTEGAIQAYETQKIIQLSNNDSIDEDTKMKLFKDSFTKLTESTIGTISNSISKIDTSQGSTDNQRFIREFVNNADKEIFKMIQDHLEKLKEQNTIKPIVVPVTDEMREQGITGDTIEIPLIFDSSTFFA